MNDDLLQLRLQVNRLLVGFLGLQVPLVFVVSWLLGHDIIWPTIGAASNAAVAALMWRRAPAARATRITITVASVVMVSIFVAVCGETRWQSDVHMSYFAMLAMATAYCDPFVLLAGAAVVAVHHIGLNFFLPALIFDGGSQFLRVLLHAAILLLETGALVWMCHHVGRLVAARSHLTASLESLERARELEAEVARQRAASEAERAAAESEKAEAVRIQAEVVGRLGDRLHRLSQGDLTIHLSDAFPADYERLRVDFNATLDSLVATVRDIVAANASIVRGAEQITAASDELAKRTEQQAANLEETSATLNVITGTVRSTAESARAAAAVAAATREAAESSESVVKQATDGMSRIRSSSNEISNIIGVIDEIAFQTNLLALNAGVEAARAGDAGRGFAVVASEVRALAQRSAEAAKEIKLLISTSTGEVENGVVHVDRTGEALRHIIQRVTEMTGLIEKICVSSQEQVTSLSEVNVALQSIDKVVQQNAEMADGTAGVARSLKNDAGTLTSLVGRFATGDDAPARLNPVHAARGQIERGLKRAGARGV